MGARLGPYGRPHRPGFALAGLLTLAVIACDLARPWPIKIVIDQVILQQPWALIPSGLAGEENRGSLLLVASLSLLVIVALGGTAHYVRTILLGRIGQEIVARVRRDLQKHLLRLDLGFHAKQRTGDLVLRLTGDAAAMRTLLAEGIFVLAQELLVLIGVFLVLAWINPLLAALAAVTFPMVGLVLMLFGRRLKRAAKRQRQKEGEIAAAVGESLSSIPTIQAYGLEQHAAARFRSQVRKSLKAGLTATRLEGSMSRWTELALATGTALLLLVGGHRVLAGQLTAGELLVVVSYGRSMYKPLRRVVSRSVRMLKAAASGERLLEVLESDEMLPRSPHPVKMGRTEGALRLEGVSYAYQPGHPVLSEVDLVVEPGERIGLMGDNGAGKSTLLSLIPRLRDPSLGRVRLDGHDLRDLELADLRRQVGVLLQQNLLFDGDLLQNIQLGNENASEQEVVAAARRAGVLQIAQALPRGLKTRVGEAGAALSAGQRQRVALARLLVRNAPIVLMDEPTTALDTNSRELVGAEVLEGLQGSTLILSSHRPEVLALMDRILVLEGGRVVQDDRPSRVLGATGTNVVPLRTLGGSP